MPNQIGDALPYFSPVTAQWFRETYASKKNESGATNAQRGAWEAIARGDHTLVISPTGTGKTLAAFLFAIDKLLAATDSPTGTKVLYLSPLKALAVDVEKNLMVPLAGIARVATELGVTTPAVTVGLRTGDTTPARRRQLVTKPPDILITTPESLFLMLTSRAAETLRGVDTVIVDEIHAIAETKRGAHLALSLERLAQLTNKPLQRIGLSATVQPPGAIAKFLAGTRPVTIVQPKSEKKWELSVTVPVPDMTEIAELAQVSDAEPGAPSIWPFIENELADLIEAHRATIVYTNSRRAAEKITARLNEVHAQRTGGHCADGTVMPAEIVTEIVYGAEDTFARAHHGSVSKERRAAIEHDLKSGVLRCVVATSSLELGIDMGAVDLVVQVEAPPTIASGLQRVGRAGHNVGDISRGIFLPKHRTDILRCAVTIYRMKSGKIEALKVPANPLDVLAQQTVSAVVVRELTAEEWFETVRQAGPYSGLTWPIFESVLDLVTGKYPSTEFAELRPRLVWDRLTGKLSARPGAARQAIQSAGTIPDRGLFAVYLMGEKNTRVGELDEEMVYESRIGDVFALGASTWRIVEITHDQVLVVPAPGLAGRLPFWHGDGIGRSAELGAAFGEFAGEISGASRAEYAELTKKLGLNSNAINNLQALITAQREATGVVPTEKMLVVERFRDEVGDWRIVLHSPYGLQVHAPWALAIGDRIKAQYGFDAQPTAADDGIVVSFPDMDGPPPGVALFIFDAMDLESRIINALSGSALFASRFRECAARALLLPSRTPGARTPLWQQRLRSTRLLEVAGKYPDFPIMLETMRECIQDVYDLPALLRITESLACQEIRVTEVETSLPSPFASALLFGFIGNFMYEGDAPVAERRAAALSVDPQLLAELLGSVSLRELLIPAAIDAVVQQVSWGTETTRVTGPERLVDLLRTAGPLTVDEILERGALVEWLAELTDQRRIIEVSINNEIRWAAVEDAGLLIAALGVECPEWVPESLRSAPLDPLGDLLIQYARTRGPFVLVDVAERFGLGVAAWEPHLDRLCGAGKLVIGEFLPTGSGSEYCDSEVLRRIRRESLELARNEVKPVTAERFAQYIGQWHHLDAPLRGVDGVAQVIEQCAGFSLAASTLETQFFPARVADYRPEYLDELLMSGEVRWRGNRRVGSRSGSSRDGWVTLALTGDELAEEAVDFSDADVSGEIHCAIREVLTGGGGYFFTHMYEQVVANISEFTSQDAVREALWDLVWAGQVGGDSLAPLRAWLAGTNGSNRTQLNGRRRSGGRARPGRRGRHLDTGRLDTAGLNTAGRLEMIGTSDTAGRWALLPVIDSLADPAVMAARSVTVAQVLLDRYGLVSRAAVLHENIPGGFALQYKVLRALEDSGKVRRGYFVEGLGGAQFALPEAVAALRQKAIPLTVALAATDPANPYGIQLDWPVPLRKTNRPGRKIGAVVVLIAGALVFYVERGGKSASLFTQDSELALAAMRCYVELCQRSRITSILETIDGAPTLGSSLASTLVAAGFVLTPRGYRVR